MSSRALRAIARTALLAAAASLVSGCGVCLVTATDPVLLQDGGGNVVEARVRWRMSGWEQSQHPASLLVEPIDVVLAPISAVGALFSERYGVLGGPFGALAALTPFANVSPAPQLPLPNRIEVDAATLALLREPDGEPRREAIRKLFPHWDVLRIWLP